MSTPKDKAPTPVEQAPAPVVSDKEITRKATIQSDAAMAMHKDDFAAGERARGSVNGAVDGQDIYESELTKMRAERDELVGFLRRMAVALDEMDATSLEATVDDDPYDAVQFHLTVPEEEEQNVRELLDLLSKYKTE